MSFYSLISSPKEEKRDLMLLYINDIFCKRMVTQEKSICLFHYLPEKALIKPTRAPKCAKDNRKVVRESFEKLKA